MYKTQKGKSEAPGRETPYFLTHTENGHTPQIAPGERWEFKTREEAQKFADKLNKTTYEKQQENNKHNFWKEILSILGKDWSQTGNDAPGTKIKIEKDAIIIETGISALTLQRLVKTKYLVSCEDTGKVRIQNLVLGGDEQ